MPDYFDRASELEEMQRRVAIESQLSKGRDRRLQATGECHNCGEHLINGGHFCDSDCRDDYQARQRSKRF